jgi:EpsI family protein
MRNRWRSLFPAHVVGALLLLAATLTASKLTEYRKSGYLAQPLESISRDIAGFHGTDNPALGESVLRELKPTSYLSRAYSNSSLQAELFIAYYAQQRAGENMHSPKHCLPGAGWEVWNYGTVRIPVAGRSFAVNKYFIEREGERMIVLYWYQSRGRVIASEYLGKILLARDALLQNSTAGSIVRIIVPDGPGALQAACSLAAGVIPQMQRCFGQ